MRIKTFSGKKSTEVKTPYGGRASRGGGPAIVSGGPLGWEQIIEAVENYFHIFPIELQKTTQCARKPRPDID